MILKPVNREAGGGHSGFRIGDGRYLYAETPPEVWRKTAELARAQDRAGRPVPLTDAHIAALCIENDLSLWTTDHHFDRFTALHRFQSPGHA